MALKENKAKTEISRKDLFVTLSDKAGTINGRLQSLSYLANSLPNAQEGSKLLNIVDRCRESYTILQDTWASGIQVAIVAVNALEFCGNVLDLCEHLEEVETAGKEQRHDKEAFIALCSLAQSLRLLTHGVSTISEEQLKDFIAATTHGR
ncbi:hypothetical protein [Vibrio phage vB_ValS_PJ32]|nr:hypothetical protein [Vibrio phage vB_ValS_PJ32]